MQNDRNPGIDSPAGSSEHEMGWNIPKPELIPPPTYWPLVLSFGATLMGLGIITSSLISAAGLAIFVLAAAKWIGELYRDQQ